MTIGDLALVSIVLISQVAATLRLWRMLNKGYIPSAGDFAALSCLLYYGVPLLFEFSGLFIDVKSHLFDSIFSLDFEKRWLVALIVAAAPWVIRAASQGNTHVIRKHKAFVGRLNPRWRCAFYCFTVVSCALLCYYSLSPLLGDASIFRLKEITYEKWGPLVIIFSLPIHFLAFYVMQEESRSLFGCFYLVFFTVVAIGSTLSLGERTNILLPFLILGVFWVRINVFVLTTCGCTLLVCASLLLPILKPDPVFSEQTNAERLSHVVSGDLSRTPVVAHVLDVTEPIGTTVMPYPGAGYVYSLLYFIPRGYAPFKGYSTATTYTAYLTRDDLEYMHWGVGLGATEEILLNFGWIFLLPGLFVYGKVLAFLDRKSLRIPALVIPKTLAAIWMFGYHLPALLLLFGFMAAVIVFMHFLFGNGGTLVLQTSAALPHVQQSRPRSLAGNPANVAMPSPV